MLTVFCCKLQFFLHIKILVFVLSLFFYLRDRAGLYGRWHMPVIQHLGSEGKEGYTHVQGDLVSCTKSEANLGY